jgi:phage terminase large subunit-like protein
MSPRPEPGASLAERIAALNEEGRRFVLAGLSAKERAGLRYVWPLWRRDKQAEPAGAWRVWLVLAGRGFGKTRLGAEWVRAEAERNRMARIALVGATMAEVRAVMVEGPSGLLSACPPERRPVYEPSLNRLRWPGGARAYLYSAAEPESLRGPQHHLAWCDEAAKWPCAEAAWDNLMLGLRCGDLPRALVTTTPRPVALLRALVAREEEDVAVVRGASGENRLNLAADFLPAMEKLYGGTRLGRQELDGELIGDVEGSLWPRALIEEARQSHTLPRVEMKRIVVGVDPPASAGGDACGIVVCGLGEDGLGYVLADASVAGLRPEVCAAAVAHAAQTWGADRVIAEGNQGGNMVESVLRSVESRLPVRIVHARHGKTVGAEPVASLFERGRARFAGAFPELEDQLTGLTIGGGYEGPGRSPDRADAMVWALAELMLGRQRGEPRIRCL